ncbi:hypothetical protein [Patulibacter minatonensis]|uniref:hypothetical protein n=1 Tax=Patulibacter minatonensis TaxID=298163 RepID=UPI00047AC5C2|nr:hypothetical protein [Patulibacter minatonensis]
MRASRPALLHVLPLAGAVVALATVGVQAASAAFLGEAEDPAGDATVPEAERDITAAGFGYDPATGRMGAAVRLRGPSAGAPATLIAYAGRRTATGCDRGPTIGFASDTDRDDASWLRTAADASIVSRGRIDKAGGRSALQRFDVSSSALRDLKADCALISTTALGDGTTIYDRLSFDLKGQPELSLSTAGLPSRLTASSKRHALRVVVRNPGHGPTGKVRVRLGTVRGMLATRSTVTLPSIASGKSRTAAFRVRFSKRARLRTEIPATAKAGRLTVETVRDVRVQQPQARKPRRSGGGGGTGGTPSSCVRYFPDFSGESGGSLGLVPCLR